MHEGHRERLRNRFINEGLENFESHNVLELLLFYAIPQRDTNEIAHRLIDEFGSLSEVFQASVTDLMRVKGISKYSAVFITMIPQICNRYEKELSLRSGVSGLEQIAEFAANCFIGLTTEHFLLICADNLQNMISYHFISEGSVNSSPVDMRKITHILMSSNATAAVIAHNHPRGGTAPSHADLTTTLAIARSLDAIQVKLLDHVVVSKDGYLSMASEPKKYGCYFNPC